MRKVEYKFILLSVVLLLFFCCLYWFDFFDKATRFLHLISDKERVSKFIGSSGLYAPVVFMFLQVFQVILAPIPGEVTGFIGGYFFGAFKGFLYSTFSLTIGSWINFCIGRSLSRSLIRFKIPNSKLVKFEDLVSRKGFSTVFFCFLFPGFPKDYLCLFLGIVNMSPKKFIFLVTIGRMPGTFLLSFQGASFFDGNFYVFLIFIVLVLVVMYFGERFRKRVFKD